MNAALVHALDESGYGLVSSTRLHGRYAIRLCVLNHTSGLRDVLDVLSWLETHDVALPAADAIDDQIRAHPILDRPASYGLRLEAGSPNIDPAELAALDVFAGVDDATLQFIAGTCHEKHAALGEHIVRRWDNNRDFYVISRRHRRGVR